MSIKKEADDFSDLESQRYTLLEDYAKLLRAGCNTERPPSAKETLESIFRDLGPEGTGIYSEQQINEARLLIDLPRAESLEKTPPPTSGLLYYAGYRYDIDDNVLILPEDPEGFYPRRLYKDVGDPYQVRLFVALMWKRGGILTYPEIRRILDWRGTPLKADIGTINGRITNIRKRIDDVVIDSTKSPYIWKHLNVIRKVGVKLT
jgi:hypothetical protein